MTIKDIARISGFGVTTVSRALNGHPDISKKTREAIEAVVAEYKFTPNANARQLKQTVSKNILIIVKGQFNLFFASIIAYMQSAIDQADLNAIVHYIDERDDEVLIAHRLENELKPLGIVFLGGNTELFQKSFHNIEVPSVLCSLDAEALEFDNLSSVSVDDFLCGKIAVEYLIKMGHTQIGFIAGSLEGSYASQLRLLGGRESLTEHSLAFDFTQLEESRFSMQSGYDAAMRLLDKSKSLTAIFAMADIMALGAMRAIADRKLRIPEDISIIGFDGIELADFYVPRLTTLKQPEEKMAQKSIELLLNMIQHSAEKENILLAAELIENESIKQCNHNI